MQNTQKSEIDSKYHFYVCHLSRTELLEINPWLEVIQNIWIFWTFFVKIIIFLWKNWSWRNFTESSSMQRIKSSLIRTQKDHFAYKNQGPIPWKKFLIFFCWWWRWRRSSSWWGWSCSRWWWWWSLRVCGS